MNNSLLTFLTLFIFVFSVQILAAAVLVPSPDSAVVEDGVFRIPLKTFRVKVEEPLAKRRYNSAMMALDQGLKMTGRGCLFFITSGRSDVILMQNASLGLGEEGYRLRITRRQIRLEAETDTGLFYGIQSLLMLIQTAETPELPCCTIIDKPRLKWRAFMLDSGRQYHSLPALRHYLNLMARLKLNLFHWHLTETGGWRIEVKAYPELTEVGSKVCSGTQQQGFYTQEEIRELVAYAQRLHITVMPEIDIPGHCEAMLAAYPQFSCSGGKPRQFDRFSEHIVCGGKDSARVFIRTILSEIVPLFPGPFFHLGGDEAPKEAWKNCLDCQSRIREKGLKDENALQTDFMNEFIEYLSAKGKRPVIWSDAADDFTKLPKNTVIHWWNGHYPEKAAKAGLDIFAGVNRYGYLNYPQHPWRGYGKNRTASLEDTYERNGSYRVNDSQVIGMSASLWTDFNLTEQMLDSRIFPRIYVLAEQMWFSGKLGPLKRFAQQIPILNRYFQSIGFNPPPFNP